MIRLTKNDGVKFSDMYFVLSARETNKSAIAYDRTKNLFVDSENLVCTDKARMHLIKGHNMEAGQYEVVKFSKTEILFERIEKPEKEYLNYKATIPNMTNYIKSESSIVKSRTIGISIAIRKLYKQFPDLFLNLNYVDSVLDHVFKNYEKFDIYYNPELKSLPVIFESENKQALICQLNSKILN